MTRPLFGLDVSARTDLEIDPRSRARVAEELGFDFVSISDHPAGEQPSYEMWTLLTWLAATTTRITVMSRVLAVPFRVPALIAKSTESLDRLSGGRVILGLGAGYDDREIASLGLPARSPGQKLRGLAEAVRIIRGMWAEPAFTVDGDIYRTDRVALEPKPMRAIPIWLGTFGPRALEITGQLADGWIPSRGYVPDDQLPVMRRRVLDAAEGNGRDPAGITCALNLHIEITAEVADDSDSLVGPPQKIIDELGQWMDRGFTAFNVSVSGEKPEEQIEKLAREVIPALGASSAR